LSVSTNYEEKFRKQGFKSIAGIDEVGRGPLAGPVVASAVILPKKVHLKGLDDSKKLAPALRERLYHRIVKQALGIGVGEVSEKIIDQIGILQATLRAMRQAVENLKKKPDFLLIDGRSRIRDLDISQKTIIDGDGLSTSIAAASVIAKVTRDNIMEEYDKLYPQYGFSEHKGYATAQHLKALKKYGPCPIHRRTFRYKKLGSRRAQTQMALDF